MRKLKNKLSSLFILISVIPLFVLGLVTVLMIQKMAVTEAEQRLNYTFEISNSIAQRQIADLKFTIRDANRRIYSLLQDDQVDLLKNEFIKYCRKYNLDFFELTDAGGKVIFSFSNPDAEGTDISADKFFKHALRFGLSASPEVMEKDELQRLGLQDRAVAGTQVIDRALVLKVAMPVINMNEIIVGTLQAGYVLHNDAKGFLNEIKAGTGFDASFFLGAVRVAGTLRKTKTLILGETLNPVVARKVLVDGKSLIARIPVGGELFRTGYQPIRNSEGKIIGMAGIGIPEIRVFTLRNRMIGFFIAAMLATLFLSAALGAWKGRRIVTSVGKLRRGIEAFAADDLLYRVDIQSNDEMEELADFFNHTMAQLLADKKQIEACSLDIGRLEHTVQQSRKQLADAQKKLLEFERMAAMGRMATALSHELRNTFAEIDTGLYALKQKLSGAEPEITDTVESLRVSLEHATKILTDALSFSYPKKPVRSLVDINYLVDDLLAMPVMKDLFRQHAIKIEKSVMGKLTPLSVDAMLFREMFSNIIVNGVQAMGEGGKLSIALERTAASLLVRISDTGPGIPEETLQDVFTPFFTTKSRGLGLGLCIAKSIAEEHGGKIEVYSKQGRGTTFVISIPVERQGAGA